MTHKQKRTIFALSPQDGPNRTSASCQLTSRIKCYRKSCIYIMLNIKKFIVYALAIASSLLFLQCDKIEEPFKESPEQNVTADTPYFEVRTDFIQKYLLEDFTGHTCLNCPKAHTIMKEMQDAMKDTLICMAVHCGNFAEPGDAPYTADYRTALGNYLESHFSVSGLPKGMISRRQFNGKRVLNYSEWKADMASVTRLPAEIGIQIKDTTVPSHPDTAYIFVKTTWLKGTERPMRLSIVLLEDSIISAQKQPDLSIISDYVHNHMLRASLSPIEGTVLNTDGKKEKGESDIRAYALYRNPVWQWKHCHIVAMVIDTETEEILQVEKIHLEQ